MLYVISEGDTIMVGPNDDCSCIPQNNARQGAFLTYIQPIIDSHVTPIETPRATARDVSTAIQLQASPTHGDRPPTPGSLIILPVYFVAANGMVIGE